VAPSGHVLWLMRHAKTVADPPPGGDDFDRVLAPRGRRDAAALAELISPDGRGLGADPPQVAFVSPAVRTRATADIVLGSLADPPTLVYPDNLYGAEPNDVLAHLAALPEDVHSAMVIGHNPTAQAIATGLIAKSDKVGHDLLAGRGFPTCALGIYELTIASWSDIDGRTARLFGLLIPPFGED
jgi:phosphohistidine phosphatase